MLAEQPQCPLRPLHPLCSIHSSQFNSSHFTHFTTLQSTPPLPLHLPSSLATCLELSWDRDWILRPRCLPGLQLSPGARKFLALLQGACGWEGMMEPRLLSCLDSWTWAGPRPSSETTGGGQISALGPEHSPAFLSGLSPHT